MLISNCTIRRLVAFAALLLASCAGGAPRYAEPTDGDTATVTFLTISKSVTHVVWFSGREYLESRGNIVAVLHCVVCLYEPNTDQVTVKVRAGEPFRFLLKSNDLTFQGSVVGPGTATTTAYVCQTHSSFVPASGANYVVEHSLCSASLYVLGPDGARQPDPTLKNLKNCLDPRLSPNIPGRMCTDDFVFE
jgi:hypothetical protein